MVAVATLESAAGKGSERITRIGPRLVDHKASAEHFGGHILITVGTYMVNQIIRDNHLVNDIPIVSVCVSSDTILKHLPHRVEELAFVNILHFDLGMQVFLHGLRYLST